MSCLAVVYCTATTVTANSKTDQNFHYQLLLVAVVASLQATSEPIHSSIH